MHKHQAIAAEFLSEWFSEEEDVCASRSAPRPSTNLAADSSRYRSDEVELPWLACL